LYNNHCYKNQRTVISNKFTSTCFSDPRAYNSTTRACEWCESASVKYTANYAYEN